MNNTPIAANPRNAGEYGEAAVNPSDNHIQRSDVPAGAGNTVSGQQEVLWERVFSRDNLLAALRRVEKNAGAAGADGLRTEELRSWCLGHWTGVREQLDTGTYHPLPVRQVMIPKPDGGERKLGVPAVLDRLIQQAIAQVLVPVFDLGFVPVSYGFRPDKSAHDAVRAARTAIGQGRKWVIEVDLDAFFDRVATLLGYGFYFTASGVGLRVAPKALKRAKARIKQLTSRKWSISMGTRIRRLNQYIRGWMGYFRLADTPRKFADLDEWYRRRLRQIRWKEWKRPRTRVVNLAQLGISAQKAWEWGMSSKGYWRTAGSPILQRALPNEYWHTLGLTSFHDAWRRYRTP
ncbi:group II intron maturase-specific domain-containing protein [Arthrobacter castelli]|uniref:group II intron maturase-specific domain-containing protein n=1 Tax=Arthrobacter castelli TaxID=271431 RepID=UPI00041FCE4E|nr:group II intron maturase-specific domain-containing protein [Arthrobacter castelli]